MEINSSKIEEIEERKRRPGSRMLIISFILFIYLLNQLLGKPYAPINKNNFLQTNLLYCEKRKKNSLIVN